MITYKDCYKILEEIRIEKQVSVEELCEGIISPRTYYRYLNLNGALKTETFSLLVDRLELDLSNLVLYGIHFRAEDPGLVRFPYREQFKSYHDIKPIYDKISKIRNTNTEEFMALEVYLLRYEYSVGIINKEKYYEALVKLNERIKSAQNNSYLIIIKLFLIELVKDSPYANLEELGKDIIKLDFKIALLYYFFSIDKILELMIEHKNVDKEIYKEVYNHFNAVKGYFYIKNITTNNKLYYAYYLHINDKKEESLKHIFLYLIEMMSMYGGQLYEGVINRVEKAFNIKVKEFLINETQKQITNKHIKII